MSCNYAEGLSPYNNKGKLGLPEIFDEPDEVTIKVEKLAEWIKSAKHVVCHTGAGISTSSGIPDFRGPTGVWTLEEKGLKPNINVSFDQARPTLTHMALSELAESNYVKYIISQNIDGLHLRSGLKRSFLSELHGNMFVERCGTCEKEFIRSRSAPSVGQKEIGLPCKWIKSGGRACRGKLHDNILDWEHNLPERDLEMAIMHSSLADLSICLGTTLQIVPAGNLPLKAKKNPNGKLVIINLQPTKNNNKADLVIHCKVDEVMSKLAQLLNLNIQPYSEELDPSRKLYKFESVGVFNRVFDWTIPLSSITKLKKFLAAIKGESDKKPKSTGRKRSRRKIEDSDSDNDIDDDFISTEKYNPPSNPRLYNKRSKNEQNDIREEPIKLENPVILALKSEVCIDEYDDSSNSNTPLDLSINSSITNTNSSHNNTNCTNSDNAQVSVALEDNNLLPNSSPPQTLTQNNLANDDTTTTITNVKEENDA